MSRLSVIMITLNEEANLARALSSVNWADEIVVVDSGSTDRTVEIAQSFKAKVFQSAWEGFGRAKQSAADHATGEWLLSLDADEEISPALAIEIKQVISSADSYPGYSLPRKTMFLGRWILHCGWYPDHVLRLFKRSAGRFDTALVHERVLLQGDEGRLTGEILHYSYPNLELYLEKLNRYTTLGAEESWREGKRANWFHVVVKPPIAFFKHYISKRGFLDGLEGFILCALSAMSVMVKYAKLRHMGRKKEIE
ncbi:MAG: glycosyltransferase family 2 protein [bacterium]|nr:glycosyltransferase family 2 protein [bacterium]